MNVKEKEALYVKYGANNMSGLIKICRPILQMFGGIADKDRDDFYSIANYELMMAIESYDESMGAAFESYLITCISRKFKTELTRRNTQKRGGGQIEASLDAPIGDDGILFGETIQDNNGENGYEEVEGYSEGVQKYLDSLSPKQLKFVTHIMNGYSIEEAQEEMGFSSHELSNMLMRLRDYDKAKYITIGREVESNTENLEEKKMGIEQTQTLEKSKMEKYTVSSLIKKMNNCTINFDHPLQRHAGQWSTEMKSDLISDILQGNPIPALVFAEQVFNGVSIIYDLDGKQRCTTVKDFVEGRYKISKSVKRNIITYQSIKMENGHVCKDENDRPIAEIIEFDIVNKKFGQLPQELQDKIMDYCFDATLYLSCSDEDVAYHINRYNQGRAMNTVQKSIINIGEGFARRVKAIAALPFFQDNGFTFRQYNNGTIDRICIEAVMLSEFADDWKKSPEDIARFINENATEEMFDDLEDTVERIENVIDDATTDLFNAKNAFLWLTVFGKFKKTGMDDVIFGNFLMEFVTNLQFVKIDGSTFDELDAFKNTKDKTVVLNKLHILYALMDEYLKENAA